PGPVQPRPVRVRAGVHPAAALRARLGGRLRPHDHPAHRHGRVRPGRDQARGTRMTSVPVPARAMTTSAAPGPEHRKRGSRRRLRRASRRAVLNLLGVLVALFALFPVLWMISTAFKPPTELYSLTPHSVPLHPTLAN